MRSRFRIKKLNWSTLIIVAAGVIEMFLLMLGGIKMLEFTDSSQFCGQLCHTPMTPEFKAFQISPHSRVECATCHVGSGASYFMKSKVSGIPLIVATVFNTYPRPIPTPVLNLRPARDTCEECHWPQKFSDDRLKTYVHYSTDEANTKNEFQLAFRVGGGEGPTANAIHWHIASKVWYLPLDEKNIEIAWVGVENTDGTLTQYYSSQFQDQATADKIDAGKKVMDCLDCHNRATHIFKSPDDLVDEAIIQGRIDGTLPFIKKKAIDALDVTNPSFAVTESKIAALDGFYQQQYPQVYQQKKAAVTQAQTTLTDLMPYVIFPEMRTTWQTHENDLSHEGCFRCHGKLTANLKQPTTGLITDDCSVCHYTLSGSPDNAPTIPHPIEGRANCLQCHGASGVKPFPSNHAGKANSSCTTCHLPGLVARSVPHVIQGNSDCLQCHAAGGSRAVPVDHAGRGNDLCTGCHVTAASPKPLSGTSIPHSLQGVTECLQCHGAGAFVAYPLSHAGRGNGTCLQCHKAGTSVSALSGPSTTHSLQGISDCLPCHGKGAFKAYPVNHNGRPTTSCVLCHAARASAPSLNGPSVSHVTQGVTDCMQSVCHASGGMKPVPTKHAGRQNSTCLLCHKGDTR